MEPPQATLYRPPAFREDRIDELRRAMAEIALATLITTGSDGGLTASHLPLMHEPDPPPFGRLRGHVARANPQWRNFDPARPALAIFLAPSAYITPNWYATKHETGRVVPTWNYVAIHASGQLSVTEDEVELRALVGALTQIHERLRARPWQVADAPADFVRSQIKGIVGVTLMLEKLEGKYKLSQNRPEADRKGVVAGLNQEETLGADWLAGAMRAREP